MHIHIVNPQEERFSAVLLCSEPWGYFPVQGWSLDIRDFVRDVIFHGIIKIAPSSLPTEIPAEISVRVKSRCDNSAPKQGLRNQDPVWIKFLLLGIPIIEIIGRSENSGKAGLRIGTWRV
jgi:hypothetical protein